MPRECGECNFCCTHIHIEKLSKPAGTICQHDCKLAAGRCGIYQNRPSECAQYSCAWLDGFLPDDLRPDKSGLLLERVELHEPLHLTMIIGSEMFPGSFTREMAEKIADTIQPGCACMIVVNTTEEIFCIGNEEDVAFMTQWMAQVRRDGVVYHKMADGVFRQDLSKDPHAGGLTKVESAQ